MRKTIRQLLTAAFAAALSFVLFCTINDDNGNPVSPGIPADGGGGTVVGGDGGAAGGGTGGGGTTGGGGAVTAVPSIFAENGYAGIGDTVSIIVTLLADTSRGAAAISGGSIKVSPTRSDDWVSSGALTTNANGQAIVRFSSKTEGAAGIRFSYGTAAERSITIEVTDNPPRNMTISASPPVLAADGSSKSTITVQVKNNDNNPIVGDVIKFSANIGLITAQGTTDAEGKATAQLTSEKRNSVATVTATLKSDGSRSVKIAVEFSGVTISASLSPETIKPNGQDTATVLAVLLDAANNPIIGEKITFSKEHAETRFIRADSATNNRGEARCVIATTATDGEWFTIRAAGAEKTARVTYSNQIMTITEAADNAYISGNANSSTFTVRYTQGNGTTPISGADLRVTVTMGVLTDPDNPDPASVIFAQIFKSDGNGELTFTINNPNFTGLATVYVKGVANNTSATASTQINFKANGADAITISASPDVIGTNSGKAKLTATVYDVFGNRVRDEIISFNVIAGPGGGEYLDPPTATTDRDGTASTYLFAGSIPSTFKGVKVVASTYHGLRSDTVALTIAGPPKHITVRNNIDNISSGTATYSLKVVALVTDINNNPVPDGTEVTFSSLVVGYTYYMLEPRVERNSSGDPVCKMDTVAVDVESECFGGTRDYTPFPPFDDVNRSGFPERTARICNDSGNAIITSKEGALSDNMYDLYRIENTKGNRWLVVNGGIPAYDVDLNRGGVCDPSAGNAVILTRTVLTKNGIADNELIYGQSDAGKIRVKIWAECSGLVTSSPQEIRLPRSEGARNWNYFD